MIAAIRDVRAKMTLSFLGGMWTVNFVPKKPPIAAAAAKGMAMDGLKWPVLR